jgi:hypothetical protein
MSLIPISERFGAGHTIERGQNGASAFNTDRLSKVYIGDKLHIRKIHIKLPSQT